MSRLRSGVISGTGSIVKTGTGYLRFQDANVAATTANTFSGGVVLKEGRLYIGKGGSSTTATNSKWPFGTGTVTLRIDSPVAERTGPLGGPAVPFPL